jgi:hydroxyacylglutathione hydrolase/adenylyltransferase/sulfurtransferase
MPPAAPDESPLEISTTETARALEDESAVVVDVREDDERQAGYIGGTRHIAVGDLAARAESLPRERPVIFYCLSGARSAMAAQAFRAAGYDARSMAGGIAGWDAEGRPLSPEGGQVAGH